MFLAHRGLGHHSLNAGPPVPRVSSSLFFTRNSERHIPVRDKGAVSFRVRGSKWDYNRFIKIIAHPELLCLIFCFITDNCSKDNIYNLVCISSISGLN